MPIKIGTDRNGEYHLVYVQEQDHSCGIACAAMAVHRVTGYRLSERELRRLSTTTPHGYRSREQAVGKAQLAGALFGTSFHDVRFAGNPYRGKERVQDLKTTPLDRPGPERRLGEGFEHAKAGTSGYGVMQLLSMLRIDCAALEALDWNSLHGKCRGDGGAGSPIVLTVRNTGENGGLGFHSVMLDGVIDDKTICVCDPWKTCDTIQYLDRAEYANDRGYIASYSAIRGKVISGIAVGRALTGFDLIEQGFG